MNEDERLAAILARGGCIIMHRNDAERLKEATVAGNRPNVFSGTRIIVDQTGTILEGSPVAAIVGASDRVPFNFIACFDA